MPQDEFDRAIANAIDATQNEIFDAAFGKEESVLDETGDRSIETMGEGLEGEHEADEDEDLGDEAEDESEGDEAEEGEDDEAAGEDEDESKQEKSKTEPEAKPTKTKPAEPDGKVPPFKLREANERARTAEAKLAEREKLFETEKGQTQRQLDELKGQLAALAQVLTQQKQPADKAAPTKQDEPPDVFENPKGFLDHIGTLINNAVRPLSQQQEQGRVATSFQIAHAVHKAAFESAITDVQKLDPNDADNRATVQRIWTSPNPGEALVQWHKRSATLREVGDDPAAYKQRVQTEARDALMKDPEFRKQLLADLRAEAEGNGNTITDIKPPRSLNGARGSRVSVDTSQFSDDPQAIFDSAFAQR